MKIFFGRINLKQNPTDQFEKAYYQSKRGTSYFSELNDYDSFEEESVYVFMIGGNTVELWKASHWGKDGENLYFTKTGIDLDNMTRAWLASFRYFYLNSDLIVFTVRRPYKKAFFNIGFIDEFTEKMLLNPMTYSNLENYRNIRLETSEPESVTKDLIFFKNNKEWKFKSPAFFDESLALQFRDNTLNIGKGRTNKDNKLILINNSELPASFDPNDLTLLNVYDVFFCDYNATIDIEISLLENENIFKISMSSKDIDDQTFELLLSENKIIVHKDTKSKGTSYEKQGDVFVNNMKQGDYFYLCRGNSRFIAVGRVTSPAEPCFIEDYGKDGWMQRSFELIKDAVYDDKYDGPSKWWTPNNNSTCILIPEKELDKANKLIFMPYFEIKVQKSDNASNVLTDQEKDAKKNMATEVKALNTILYGPPGTGKTFNSIDYAIAIIENRHYKDVQRESEINRDGVKRRFDQYVASGQIVFTTFHQSLSYEDFIEGIKPVEPATEEDELTYAVEDGIFKKLCTEAAFSFIQKRATVETEKVLDFSAAYDRFVDMVNERLSQGERVGLETRSGGNVYIENITQKNNIWIKHNDGKRIHTVSKSRLSRIAQAFPDLTEVTNINDQFRAEIGGSNSSAYWAVLNAIRKQKQNATNDYKKSISEKGYSYDDKKDIISSLKPDDYKIENPKRFVIIIDEINRGNVSQIFGELITLIEDDKRLGAKEVLKATLPYSKESFGVPCNVYLVGTMNTADRSVEALDSALRRRFSFVLMPPEPIRLGITSDGINLQKILEVLNERLSILKDTDHTIGHAWFWNVMDVEGLKTAFKNKIIPLLQEYFYNDYEKLGLVLGDTFFETHKQINSNIFASFSGGNGLAGQYDQTLQYRLKSPDDLTIGDFKSLEQSNNKLAIDEQLQTHTGI